MVYQINMLATPWKAYRDSSCRDTWLYEVMVTVRKEKIPIRWSRKIKLVDPVPNITPFPFLG